MNWKDKTITLGELSLLIREERVIDDTIRAEWMGEGLTAIAHKAGAFAGLSDEEQLEFVNEAGGER